MQKIANKETIEHLKKLDKYLNSKDTIITNIYRYDGYNDYPKFYQYSTEYKKFKNSNLHLQANGFSEIKEEALLKSVMETIERWYIFYPERKLVSSSYSKINKKSDVINPSFFTPFSSNQLEMSDYNHFIIDDFDIFKWTYVKELITGKSYKIPAQLIYLGINERSLIRLSDSTGAAAAFSLEQALYYSICELVERDAIAIAYHNRLQLPSIRINTIPYKHIHNLLQYLHQYLFDIKIYDATLDINIPVYISVLIDKTNNTPVISVGSKCNINRYKALYGSILESIQSLTMRRDHFNLKKLLGNTDYMRSVSFSDEIIMRMNYWSKKNSSKNINFWLNNSETISYNNYGFNTDDLSYTDKLNYVLKELQRNNIQKIYYKELGSNILNRYGITAIKVLIPELTQFSLVHNVHYFGSKRIFTVPVKEKYLNVPMNESNLNTFPHPFT